MIHGMLAKGVSAEYIAHACMPSEITEFDYIEGEEVRGGWLDLQEILRGLLYQAQSAINPLARLIGIEQKAAELLQTDADAGLFILFQALADASLGYCATHALLCALVGELTAAKLGLSAERRAALFRAALTMNIGMARLQDSLVSHSGALNEGQKKSILEHPKDSHAVLLAIGVSDEDQLDIVRWHHEEVESLGLTANLASRRVLRIADAFVAKLSARRNRLALSALGAARSLVSNSAAQSASVGSAMAATIGFYPPGTYVQLANGDKAVCVARGARANSPHVLSIVNPTGMPMSKYMYRDTSDPQFAIRAPVNADTIKVKVNLDKVLKIRAERGI
jgi:HD-GYP domain-containing protein (c-di-GMP phosphodiesterase class II)